MNDDGGWVEDTKLGIFTDLYELTMLQAYWNAGMSGEATFSLFVRRLPPHRNYLVAAGLAQVLHCLGRLSFNSDALGYLSTLGLFTDPFLSALADFRFTGDVYAVPEGTPVFANEPLIEIVAPIGEAQLAETVVMNQISAQTVLASKAARIVEAAEGRTVADFGGRRAHGADAALKGARAFHIAGVAATSNVLAGRLWGIPVAGTMAHSFVQAHNNDSTAFRDFARLYPETTLLVDTYDTMEGVEAVIALARELGPDFRIHAVRLDSGDLLALAKAARARLDAAGLAAVEIFASSGLDEAKIAALVAGGAPITGFGVGTSMAVADDAPAIDLAYKLSAYDGRGRVKLSPGKRTLPGRKQVFREEEGGIARRDVIARAGETLPGRPLLEPVMREGRVLDEARPSLDDIRAYAMEERARLPAAVRGLAPAEPPYPVLVSEALEAYAGEVEMALGGKGAAGT